MRVRFNNRLYRNCEGHQPCILVIKDFDDYIYGAFISDYLRSKNKFYGTGECFLFTFEVNYYTYNFKIILNIILNLIIIF